MQVTLVAHYGDKPAALSALVGQDTFKGSFTICSVASFVHMSSNKSMAR